MRHYIFIFVIVLVGRGLAAQTTDVVRQYCNSLAAWAADKNISNLHAMENLRSSSPAFRIGNRLMNQLASKNALTETATYDWDVYIPCLQKEIDNGIQVSFSNIKAVPEDYIEQKYPGLQYVSCNINVKGSITTELQDLFILKENKIVKIADYIESTDIVSGKKKIEVDYLDLARSAFADKDYIKCYSLYKEGALRSINRKIKDYYVPESDIFPYVESCIALGKWEDAMHGITDNKMITNRKRWINGVQWKLDPEDLKIWNRAKEPLMDYLLKETFEYYCLNTAELQNSPLINHVCRCRNISIDRLKNDAALYFWTERRSWHNEVHIRAAAELGHFDAQKQLGKYYLTGYCNDPVWQNRDTIPCDTVKAVRWFERSALQGDVESANIAAHHFISGNGVARDFAKAYSLYSLNASQNDYDSQYGLGLCYYYGLGVEKDSQLAIRYLTEAIDWHPEVPYMIGNLYYEDNYNPLAVTYFNRALKRPNLNSSVRRSIFMVLSDCNRYGRCGLPVDLAEAERLHHEADKLRDKARENIYEYLISLTHITLLNYGKN